MRFKLTFILLLLNIAAGYYIYHLHQDHAANDSWEKENNKVLGNEVLDIERLTITIKTDKDEVLNVERQRDSWVITDPISWPANKTAVQQIINQLQFLEKEISFTLNDIENRGQTLADYGLAPDQPNLTLSFANAGGKSQSIRIGAPTEMGSRIYILHPSNEEILVVSDALLKSISTSIVQMRSQDIFNIPVFETRSVMIQVDEQRVRIEKDKNDWHFVTPISALANNQLMASMLTEVCAARVIQLLPPDTIDLNTLGLETPKMRITLGGNNRRETLLIGNAVPAKDAYEKQEEAVYAKLEDNATVFTMFKAPFTLLDQAQETLREKHFSKFDVDKVTSLTISRPPLVLTLQKLEKQQGDVQDTWQLISKKSDDALISESADTEVVRTLLSSLSHLNAVNFVSDSPSPGDIKNFGLENPVARFTLQLDEGKPMTILLGDSNKENLNNIFAKSGDADFVYEVRLSSVYLALNSTRPLIFKTRSLEKQPKAARIKSITVTQLEKDTTLFEKTLDLARQTWPTALDDLEDKEKETVLRLIDFIKNDFQVKEYIENEFPETPFNPWVYRLDVDIVLPGGQEDQLIKRQYYFSKRLGGSKQIGGSPDLSITFWLTQDLIDILFPLTFEKDPIGLPQTPQEVNETDLSSN